MKNILTAIFALSLIACSSAPAPEETEIWPLETHDVTATVGNGFVVCRAAIPNHTGHQLHALKGNVTFTRQNAPSLTLEFEDTDINHMPGSTRLVAYPRAYTDAPEITGCSIRMVGTRQKQFVK
jgi:hypothetical protein